MATKQVKTKKTAKAENWQREADELAKYLEIHLPHAHRGAFAVGEFLIVFDNHITENHDRTIIHWETEGVLELLGTGVGSTERDCYVEIFREKDYESEDGPSGLSESLAEKLNSLMWQAAFGDKQAWSDHIWSMVAVHKPFAEAAIAALDLESVERILRAGC